MAFEDLDKEPNDETICADCGKKLNENERETEQTICFDCYEIHQD